MKYANEIDIAHPFSMVWVHLMRRHASNFNWPLPICQHQKTQEDANLHLQPSDKLHQFKC